MAFDNIYNGVPSGVGAPAQPSLGADVTNGALYVGNAGVWKASGVLLSPNANTALFNEFAKDSIVAFAGGGQASATQLVAQTNRIITVATAGDSVKLPASAAGLELLVINHGANPMQVFGLASDTIDDIAFGTGVSQMQNSLVIYTCTTAGSWYTEGLATGFGGPGLQTQSSKDNITAFATGGQTNAVLLNTMISRVTIVGTAADSVKLPASAAGMQLTVINAAAANSMNVFPFLGDSINALSANAALAVAANKTATFTCATAGVWHSILTA